MLIIKLYYIIVNVSILFKVKDIKCQILFMANLKDLVYYP